MNAVLRLVLLSIFALALCGIALLTVQRLGSNPTISIIRHPWASQAPWSFARMSRCPENIQALPSYIQQIQPGEIWWIDVYPKDGGNEWRVFCTDQSISHLTQQGFGPDLSLKDVLDQVLKFNLDVVLNIHTRTDRNVESILDDMKAWEKSEHVGLISPVRSPITKLRKERPQWIFGSDQPSLAKAFTFESWGILGITELWPDFYVIPNTLPSNSEKFKKALSERGKIVVLESQQIRYLAP